MPELEIPEATENVPCPLCGASTGVVVGEKGRFGMPVRNLCCETCATVYVSPRPSAAAMAEYYRSTYRKHYGGVSYPNAQGKGVAPGQPGFDEALLSWHQKQAGNALTLLPLREGATVLEVGCRHGKTLNLMQAQRPLRAFGIEPGEEEAEQARQAGIDCFTGALEDFAPGEQRFDHVQWFHVLEHVHDPLGALLKLRALLAPGGTLLVEVPNVYQPYGLLEENFFQNVHLVSYSPNTLPALRRRYPCPTRPICWRSPRTTPIGLRCACAPTPTWKSCCSCSDTAAPRPSSPARWCAPSIFRRFQRTWWTPARSSSSNWSRKASSTTLS
jgi:SAM-dependent methyltransferase